MSSGKGPVRRSQLITTFGVGSMHTLRNGVSVVTAGLDHWYEREPGSRVSGGLDPKEFEFNEWRLQDLLMVDHFKEPPDYRPYYRYSPQEVQNRDIFIPHLRFPTWYRCPLCSSLTPLNLTLSDDYPKCRWKKNDEGRKCGVRLVQVPVVAVCRTGHMQDFPWKEWVHRSVDPSCSGSLKLEARSGSSLDGMYVACRECSLDRNLARVLEKKFISQSLQSGAKYPCQGGRPWLGIRSGSPGTCDESLKGTLRSASNVYYPAIKSSIRLPLERLSGRMSIWGRMCEDTGIGSYITFAKGTFKSGLESEKETSRFIERIREIDNNKILSNVNDSLIIEIFNMHCRGESLEEDQEVSDTDRNTRFRREEFNVLTSGCNEEVLRSKEVDLLVSDPLLNQNFENIWLVHSLEEIRALIGFSRIDSGEEDLNTMRALLWKERPSSRVQDWLPAYRVKGEGIVFVFKEDKIRAMGQGSNVFSDKIRQLNDRSNQIPFPQPEVSTRFLVLHTFAHVLMRELAFFCGYPVASLRERLYVCDDIENPMAAVMVYTAAGDSQGTMGGLVRMGEPDNLVVPLRQALDKAGWCSSDPVCMEVGNQQGQGQYGLNLAACHDCCLLPNTSCEHFNNFLDRTFLIGDGGSVKGYFDR